MKKTFRFGLFPRILLAISLGVLLGYVVPDAGVRLFKTFNALFAQFLKFIVPLLIIGLVTPAIADVGKGAGRMLLVVMGLSYVSTVLAGFFAFGCATELLPHYLVQGAVAQAGNGKEFVPFFALKIPPLCDVLTALALSFMTGIGIVFTGSEYLRKVCADFGAVVKFTILKAVIPLLPLYIFTMICEMTASGKIGAMAGSMVKVIGTGVVLTICYLILQYTVAGAIGRKNPFRCLWNMLPAYLTGFSIASSSAVIPVTLECTARNGISKEVTAFVVPLCANVHMAGSAIKLVTSAVAISWIFQIPLDMAQLANFIFMMAIAAVAAPGVMGGVLMASIGLVESILHFTPEQSAMLMTFYLALDGYGPASNVTGDGAIAIIIDRFFGKKGTHA